MVDNPKVTVVMPNHNKGQFIGKAIESVLNQTFRNFEVVVVDDASTDDSIKTIEYYAQRDDRLRPIILGKSVGASAARNIGIRNSKSRIVCLLDSDDVYSPTKLEKQYAALMEDRSPAIVYSEWWRIDEKGRVLPPGKREHPQKSGQIFGDVLALGFGVNTTFMIPKECLDLVGLYDESLPWAEDYDLILRLARKYNFKHLDEALYGYRNYEGNTRNVLKRKERLRYLSYVMEKHFRAGNDLLGGHAKKQVISSLIRAYALTGQYSKMLQYGLTSIDAFLFLLRSIVRYRQIK